MGNSSCQTVTNVLLSRIRRLAILDYGYVVLIQLFLSQSNINPAISFHSYPICGHIDLDILPCISHNI